MTTTRRFQPFGFTVQQLLDEESITLSELVRRGHARADANDIRNVSVVHAQVTGKIPASPPVMRLMASALRIDVETFPEYRMWRIRQLLDPRSPDSGGVGFEVALRNLKALERGATAGLESPLPASEIAARQNPPGGDPRQAGSS